MTISNNKLDNFFSKHKVGALSSLKENRSKKIKAISTQDEDEFNVCSHQILIDERTAQEVATHENNHRDPCEVNTKINNPIEKPHHETNRKAEDKEILDSNTLAPSYQNVSPTLASSEHDVSDKLSSSYQKVSDSLATSKQQVSNKLANSLSNTKSLRTNSTQNVLTCYSAKELDLLYVLYEKCAINGERICTIYSSELVSKLAVSTLRVRNLFSRITKKGEVTVHENKRGLNALRIVEISNLLYKKLHETCGYSLAQSLAAPLYSSSSNFNTTTTKLNTYENIIDISPLSKYGFCEEHAHQLLRITVDNAPLKPEVIQNSINYFFYDLTYNNKEKEIKKTPVSFFMGIMRNEKIYNPPKNYKSQAEIAMDVILNQKKEEEQRLQKKIEEIKASRREQWLLSLTESEKNEILSTKQDDHRHTPDFAFLKVYYSNNIWPSQYNELFGESSAIIKNITIPMGTE